MRPLMTAFTFAGPAEGDFMDRPVRPLTPETFDPDLATEENERIEAQIPSATPGKIAINQTIQGE